jgi:hypothetical protein
MENSADSIAVIFPLVTFSNAAPLAWLETMSQSGRLEVPETTNLGSPVRVYFCWACPAIAKNIKKESAIILGIFNIYFMIILYRVIKSLKPNILFIYSY